MLANYLPEPPLDLPYDRIEIALSDGDRLAGKVFSSEGTITLCVFHGLGGDDERPYVRRAVRIGQTLGFDVWTVNHRGCGAGRGLAKGTYHSGVAGDLGAVFAEVRRRKPDHRIIALGFSLSGNALLLNLGDGFDGPHPQPDAAIAVNPPVNLARCSELISKFSNRAYDLYFVRRVIRSVREREAAGLIPLNHYSLSPWMQLRGFDSAYTAPAGGFADRDDYYARCSAKPHLKNITKPTVIISAEDDPFVAARDLREAELSSTVHLHLESHGGHMGYLSRDLADHRWLSAAIKHYLQQLAIRVSITHRHF
jgi:uncharacterized protein